MSNIHFDLNNSENLAGMAPAPMPGGGFSPAALPAGMAMPGSYGGITKSCGLELLG
jgi:hypothetical protein